MKVVLTEIIKREGTLTLAIVTATVGEVAVPNAFMVAHVGDIYGVGDEITPRGHFFHTRVVARSRYEALKEYDAIRGVITKEESDELLKCSGRTWDEYEAYWTAQGEVQ